MSGGILLLVGAVLWVAYLFPTIVRRRGTQSLGADVMLVERTRSAASDEAEASQALGQPSTLAERRALRKREREEMRANERVLADTVAAHRAQAQAARKAERAEYRRSAQARARRRRLRAASSALLLIGALTGIVGLALSAFGVSVWIAQGGAVAAVIAMTSLAALAVRTPPAVPAAPSASEPRAFEPVDVPETATPSTWTPTPLPQPLHLSVGSQAAATIASRDAAAALRRAALEVAAEQAMRRSLPSVAERAASRSSQQEVTRRSVAPPSATPSTAQRAASAAPQPRTAAEVVAARYAALDAEHLAAEAQLDVSAVLQRRRVG